MDPSVIVAIISGIVLIITTIVTARATQNKLMQEIRVSDAVQKERLDNLTQEVRKHNDFAQRIPVAERDISSLQSDMHEVKSDIKEIRAKV